MLPGTLSLQPTILIWWKLHDPHTLSSSEAGSSSVPFEWKAVLNQARKSSLEAETRSAKTYSFMKTIRSFPAATH